MRLEGNVAREHGIEILKTVDFCYLSCLQSESQVRERIDLYNHLLSSALESDWKALGLQVF